MLELESEGKVSFLTGVIKNIQKSDNNKVIISYQANENIHEIKIDYLIPFFGLKMDLGPISKWGLNLHQNLIMDPFQPKN